MTDTRIVHGANCSWWDSIDKVGSNDGLPCCPFCKGMLFEVPDEKTWWDGVDKYAAAGIGRPWYRKFIEWLRGKCFPGGYLEAKSAWDKLQ